MTWNTGTGQHFIASNPASAIAAAVTNPVAGTTVTGGPLIANLWDNGGSSWNVKAAGAKGDGVTDDTAAITTQWGKMIAGTLRIGDSAGSQYTFNDSPGIEFPSGSFIFNGPPLSAGPTNNRTFKVKGAGPGQCCVVLSSGFFIDNSATSLILELEFLGLQVIGGSGAIRLQNTNQAIFSHLRVYDCIFRLYTVCAIGSNSTNQPNWHVRDCIFDGTSTSSIGIALPSGGAHTVEDCNFFRDRYHIKVTGSSVFIHHNNFLRFDAYGATARTDIWLVTSSAYLPDSNQGTDIHDNRFGNEFLDPNDKRVLIADEDSGTGTDWCTHPHLATTSTRYVSQVQFYANHVAGIGATFPAVMYSTTDNLSAFLIAGNQWYGANPSYLIQFLNGTTFDKYMTDHVFGPNMHIGNGLDSPPVPVTNAVGGLGYTIDPAGRGHAQFGQYSAYPGLAQGIDYISWGVPRLDGFTGIVAGGNTSVGITDSRGSTNATTQGLIANGNIYTLLANLVVGQPGWIEFDIRSGGATPLADVIVQLNTGAPQHFQRYIHLTGMTAWTPIRIAFTPRVNAGLYLNFINPTGVAGTFQVGRCRAYHGREPYGPFATPASTAVEGAGLCVPPGVVPNVPINGDIWTTAGGTFTRINGVTRLAGNMVRTTIAYSASMTADASLAIAQEITATNGTAFTINNPTNPTDGQTLTYTIFNTSGGALGAATWGGLHHLAGAWVSPATGNNRSITFRYAAASGIWYEVSRTAADVTN